jgi:hypothetical protein
MSDDKQFETLFYEYLQNAKLSSDRDSAEQNLVGAFRSFITHAFGIHESDISQEQSFHMVNLQRRGRTDLLINTLIFEFKPAKNLMKQIDLWRTQLQNYMVQLQLDTQQNYVGLLTDGVRFEAYRLINDQIEKFDSFNLAELDPVSAYIHLDAYLYTQVQRPPTPEDVVRRFGSNSPTFKQMEKTLLTLLARVRNSPKLDTWRVQWARLLSKVYGSDITTDDLFIRHTYLAQFARLIGYASLLNRQSEMPDTHDELETILNGSAFQQFGISNIAENDFYSWVLLPEIRDEALPAFFVLINHLIVYDLSRIDQDLLKQLYQNLVDPSTRHDLGEYYTPDWLAELTLQDLNYNAPQSLYDPACGSGTFLFTAIKRLITLGMTGEELVRFCIENVMGTDVHPLAVTIARVNYLLALSKHIQSKQTRIKHAIPIYMADAMIKPQQAGSGESLILPINGEDGQAFHIPYENTLDSTRFSALIDRLEDYSEEANKAKSSQEYSAHFEELLQTEYGVSSETSQIWRQNFILLTDLKAQDRNGIWAYILKNLMRPMIFAQDKFDVVIGNPPWLSYRYVRNADYQQDVKSLYQHYNLIGKKDVKLFTQMDLSTLFYAIARDRYMKPTGKIAFVMPRAVITGAKQHRPFQQLGFSRVLDMEKVSPLFNVPSCVMIQDGEVQHDSIPSVAYKGKLPKHEMELEDANPYLTSKEAQVSFVDSTVRSEYYHPKFTAGATLLPRTLCFIARPIPSAPASLIVITDPSVVADSHAPYKSVKLYGSLEDPFIFTTLLSKHLYPFGFQRLHMVGLSAFVKDNHLKMIWNMDFVAKGYLDGKRWFEAAAKKWDELKKEDSKMTLLERWDYQRTLTNQNINAPYKIVYNSSGTNIASCVLSVEEIKKMEIDDLPSNGFVVDHKTYYYDASSLDEAHYLCAILNAPCTNQAIKAYQSQGLFGERDIHRTPFEACAIPPFDPANTDHLELARLSKEAHEATLYIRDLAVKGGITGLRRLAREKADKQIVAIDKIAQKILDL